MDRRRAVDALTNAEPIRLAGPEQRVARANAQRILTSCARCENAAFDGTLKEGHAWFAEHRAIVHGETDTVARRRRVAGSIATPRRRA
jgi:hypothetical protein